MPQDPYRKYRFRVEIDGVTQAGFNECSFADSNTEMVEYREGDEPPVFRKLSGLTKYGNITLKWGITDSNELYEWKKQIEETGAGDGKGAGLDEYGNRKNISIVLVNEAGDDKSRWEIVRAWPMKYDPTDFDAKGNDVAIESLEICHEGFKKVS